MQRDILIAIGGGLLSAVAAVSFFGGSAFSILFVYFAAVPLLMVGLGLGPAYVTIAAISGICATVVAATLATDIGGGFLHAGIFALVQALPAWVITRLTILQTGGPRASGSTPANAATAAAPDDADDQPADGHMSGGPVSGGQTIGWQSPGTALAIISMIAGIFLLIAAVTVGEGGLKGQVDTYLGTAFTYMAPSLGDEQKLRMVSQISAFFPGAIGASWVLMAVLNGVVAQAILTRAGKNIRPTPAYAAIDLPLWLSWPLIGAAAAALLANLIGAQQLSYAAYNLAMVFAVPYFFLGLAVIHTLARRVAASGMIIGGVYVVLLVSLWTALVVAGVGIAEQWVGLRSRHDKDDDDGQLPVA